MVGAESVDLERKVFYERRSRTVHCDHFWCQSLGMGCGMSWSDNPRPLVSERDVAAHQCAGTEGSRVSSEILQGPVGGQPCSITIGQHDICLTDCENGVATVEKVSGGDQRNMVVCFIAQEHDYCSPYSGQTEHHRGLRELDFQRQQQLEAVSTGLLLSSKMFPWKEVDLFADQLNHQVPRFWNWRPDPLAECVDELTVVWREIREYAFPPSNKFTGCCKKSTTKVQLCFW